ncbi:MAG: F-box protein [Parachlamydiaceae bacterium]|nr:F-box protein [Parachlamydiaceae bacterium]
MNIISLETPPLPREMQHLIFDFIPKENLANQATVCKLWSENADEKYQKNHVFKTHKDIKVLKLKYKRDYNKLVEEAKRRRNLNKASLFNIFNTTLKVGVATAIILMTSPLILAGFVFGGILGVLTGYATMGQEFSVLGGVIGSAGGAQIGSLGSLFMFGSNVLELRNLIKLRRIW